MSAIPEFPVIPEMMQRGLEKTQAERRERWYECIEMSDRVQVGVFHDFILPRIELRAFLPTEFSDLFHRDFAPEQRKAVHEALTPLVEQAHETMYAKIRELAETLPPETYLPF